MREFVRRLSGNPRIVSDAKSEYQHRERNAVMVTSGLYDEAGSFAYSAGA